MRPLEFGHSGLHDLPRLRPGRDPRSYAGSREQSQGRRHEVGQVVAEASERRAQHPQQGHDLLAQLRVQRIGVFAPLVFCRLAPLLASPYDLEPLLQRHATPLCHVDGQPRAPSVEDGRQS
eukprot:scaffold986_cov237-Pinguiococcus_pyrenoidosus.AAC.2